MQRRWDNYGYAWGVFYEYEEEAWNRYASCFEDVNIQIDGVSQEIVNVIFTILGDVTGYDWLHKPLHKFGGKSAVELLKTEKGEKQYKCSLKNSLEELLIPENECS